VASGIGGIFETLELSIFRLPSLKTGSHTVGKTLHLYKAKYKAMKNPIIA
jgi:hypothetical protein